MQTTLEKDFTFEAAHQLPNVAADHKCARLHGHSFKVTIAVTGEVDPAMGWFCDHSDISRAMKPLIEQLDHAFLNEIKGLENPTFENIAVWIWNELAPLVKGLFEITIYETPTARCIYRGK